jgi:short subunit dehydrogenase-like uncharacterized protein
MSNARVVICGATGHTGRRTAHELVAAGARPLLTGRNPKRLHEIAADLDDLEVAVVDLADPGSIQRLLSPGDVLISTVGPFATVGGPPIEAAIGAGAHYLDSTGEPSFVRKVFQHYGPRAKAAGVALLTGFGYDFVPGNLAAAVALRDAGLDAVRVDIGYYLTGALRTAAGPAARDSLARALTEPMYAWRGCRLIEEPGGTRMRYFDVDGASRAGLSIGATEHFALPRSFSQLAEVNVYLGWFGPATPLLHRMSRATTVATRVPFGATVTRHAARLAIDAGTTEPTTQSIARSRSWVAATAYDVDGNQLSHTALQGPHHLTLTARLLSWAAHQAARGAITATGALGPIQVFGLDDLISAGGLSLDPPT